MFDPSGDTHSIDANGKYTCGDYDKQGNLTQSWNHSATTVATCNLYDGAAQCMGYALMIGDFIANDSVRNWTLSYDFTKLKPGDYVRYGGHSVIIEKIVDGTAYVAECNYGGRCIIRWHRQMKIRDFLTYTTHYIHVYPGN